MSTSSPPAQQAPRFAVLQTGARMHYAVPALLARAGALAAFYTDLHSSHWPLQALKTLWPEASQPNALKRLLGRTLPTELPRSLVRDQPLASVVCGWGGRRDDMVLRRARRERFSGASALYTNFINNDLDVVRQAKEQGLHVVHEILTPPVIGRIALEERRRYPGLECIRETPAVIEAGIERDRQKWDISDRILVPSEFCAKSAIELGCSHEKILLVPYGIPDHCFWPRPSPEPGLILSVGRPSLLKGTHFLAEACRILQGRGLLFRCSVAGQSQVDLSHPVFSGPTYLGHVPRSQIGEAFRRADVFVLPTLADSFGLVHLEAMACGVPVITTPNCGSVVRDGIEGFIVPIRDAVAIADRLQEILENRPLRHQMGAAARARARDYTWQRYGENLLMALGVG